MNFADFQIRRQELRKERPGMIDGAETNLYAALGSLIPPPTSVPGHTVHRCHLAAEWAAYFGFSDGEAKRALISCGVRDSLARLFGHYAGKRAAVWLPEDNYPVYWELARAAGLQPQSFPTLPDPCWPSLPPAQGDEILLVTNPLKPLGRALEAPEVASLEQWLAASPRRRLWLDGVYTFDAQFLESTRQLLATGQTILLHSLTKGWLQPRLFGTALVPEGDLAELAPVFRDPAPPQINLARARSMLAEHAALPAKVSEILEVARGRMCERMARYDLVPKVSGVAAYLFPIAGHWEKLLANFNLLGLPASVFGSSCEDLTVLSSLSFINEPRK